MISDNLILVMEFIAKVLGSNLVFYQWMKPSVMLPCSRSVSSWCTKVHPCPIQSLCSPPFALLPRLHSPLLTLPRSPIAIHGLAMEDLLTHLVQIEALRVHLSKVLRSPRPSLAVTSLGLLHCCVRPRPHQQGGLVTKDIAFAIHKPGQGLVSPTVMLFLHHGQPWWYLSFPVMWQFDCSK